MFYPGLGIHGRICFLGVQDVRSFLLGSSDHMRAIIRLLQRLKARFYQPRTVLLDGVLVGLRDLPLTSRLRRRIIAGKYESHERQLLKSFLEAGDSVFELGASLGIISSLALKAIGPKGRLLAVEANPSLSEPFHRHLAANGLKAELVTCICIPTWDDDEDVSGWHAVHTGGNTLQGRVTDYTGSDAMRIESRTAAAICAAHHFEPNALICDIEGAESVWVTKAETIPHCVRKILVELHPWLVGPVVAGKTLAALGNAGFKVRAFSGTVFDLRRDC